MKRAALIATVLYALLLLVAVDDDPFIALINWRPLERILVAFGVSW